MPTSDGFNAYFYAVTAHFGCWTRIAGKRQHLCISIDRRADENIRPASTCAYIAYLPGGAIGNSVQTTTGRKVWPMIVTVVVVLAWLILLRATTTAE